MRSRKSVRLLTSALAGSGPARCLGNSVHLLSRDATCAASSAADDGLGNTLRHHLLLPYHLGHGGAGLGNQDLPAAHGDLLDRGTEWNPQYLHTRVNK